MKRRTIAIFVLLALSVSILGIHNLVSFNNDWQDQSHRSRGEGGPTPTDTTLFPWPMHLYDEVHNAFTSAPAPQQGDVIWYNFTGFRTYGSPAVVDGMVFIGARNVSGNFMFAFHQNNGTLAWKFQPFGPIPGGEGLSSSPAYADGYLVFGADQIYCLYANNGTVKWNITHENQNWGDGTPTIADGHVFIGASDWYVYNIDLETGTVLWRFKTLESGGDNYGLYAAPAVWNGHIYVAACDGFVYQIKIDQPGPTASANHSFNTGRSMYGSPVIFDNKVYIGNGYTYRSTANRFYALDAIDLSLVWEFYPGIQTSFFSSAAIAYDMVFVGSLDGNLYVLDPWGSGGSTWVIWQYYIGPTWSSPGIADGQVFIGSRGNYDYLYAFNVTHPGPPTYRWRYYMNGDVDSSPAIADGKVYVGTHGNGGRIYCFGDLGDISPPYPLSYSPTGSDIPLNTNFVVQWSETMDWTSVENSFSYTDTATVWDSTDGTFIHYPSNNTSVFNPTVDLDFGTTYWVTFNPIALDLAGNPLDGDGNGVGGDPLTWTFTTVTDNPPVLALWEPGGSAGQSFVVGTPVLILWSANDNDPWPDGGNVVNLSYGPTPAGGTIIAQYEPEDGSFSWDTSSVPPGTYYVNISVYDSIGQTSYDSSDYSFDIVPVNFPPDASISQPSGGESWSGGSTHDIIWDMSDDMTPEPNLVVYLNYSYTSGGGPIVGPLSGLTCPCTSPWTLPLIDATDVVVEIDVIDAGGASGSNSSAQFEVDSTAPSVLSTVPLDGQSDVALNSNIEALWNEGMNQSATESSFQLLDNSTWLPVPGQISWIGDRIIFNPDSDLTNANWYTANITTQAKDNSDPGNALVSLYSWSFRTASAGDLLPPEITDVTATPSPQEVHFNVNVSANITDDFSVGAVDLNITGPSGIFNLSMSYDSASGRHYSDRSYDEIGIHSFTIWARDSSGNANSSSGQFEIVDTTGPTLENLTIVPPSPGLFENVNVSVLVQDNYNLYGVWIDIAAVGNFSTQYDPVSGKHYDVRSYPSVGTVDFSIWANDTSDNWNGTSGSFLVDDKTPPQIVHTPQSSWTAFSPLPIDAVVTDDVQVDSVYLNYTDVNSLTYNVTMTTPDGTNFSYSIPMQGSPGVLTYFIWANDTDGNDVRSALFSVDIIDDDDPPEISNVNADPIPQEVGNYVHISARVIDDFGLQGVFANITWPDSSSSNDSMSAGPGDLFSLSQSYNVVGDYAFTIWALDTSGRWNTSAGVFEIVDTTPPVIAHNPPGSGQVGEEFNLSAVVTDNYVIQSVSINYTDVDGISHNESMTLQSGDEYSRMIEAQSSAGNMTYFFWARDTSGNEALSPSYELELTETWPHPPENLTAVTSGRGALLLQWYPPTRNVDGSPLTDLRGYNVYRMTASGGTPIRVNSQLVLTANYLDEDLGDGRTYYYVVRAVNSRGLESENSNEASGTTTEREADDYTWIIALVIVIIVIVILLLLLLLKRRRKEEVESQEEAQEEESENIQS